MARLRAAIACGLLAGALVAGCHSHDHGKDAGSGGGGANGGGGGSNAGGGGSNGGGGGGSSGDAGPGCGYQSRGTPLHVAAGIDVCLPPAVCDPETCPPPLGHCSNGACVFDSGYSGIATFPQAWATYYCMLSAGGCHGVTQVNFAEDTAQMISQQLGHPICDQTATDKCIGITATSAMMNGNAQTALDPSTGQPIKDWGLGLTEASGLCYQVTGPGGTAIVAVTDRCGGYCKCNGSGFQECGPCVNAGDLTPNCPCVGTAGAVASQCCGRGCGGPTDPGTANCDWCASNNHPHFDPDSGTFNFVCGAQANLGSCQLTAVSYVPCLTPNWPPQ